MKKIFILTILCFGFYLTKAQTKGTNTLGLGFNYYKDSFSDQLEGNDAKSYAINLGYGHFINDNKKIGFNLLYGNNDQSNNSKIQIFGGDLNYQMYYPIIKKLYAFGGGRVGYSYSKYDSGFNTPQDIELSSATNTFQLGGFGGISWFLSKRFALEADLLSANIVYSNTKDNRVGQGTNTERNTTFFDLSTTGSISNLGFKIYLLF